MGPVGMVQQVVLLMVAVPVVAVVADALLRQLNAQADNALVQRVGLAAEKVTPGVVRDIVAEQNELQTAAFALAAYGLLALVIVLVFRAVPNR